MRVVEVWRYPVKSLQGEVLDQVPVTRTGLAGDRRYAIFDAQTGFGLTARRDPALLFASARLRADGIVEITLPDGSVADGDGALSAWLGRPVSLRSAAVQVARTYESAADFEHESTSAWEPWQGSSGGFYDAPEATVSLLSTATIGRWERRRFRANLLLDGRLDGKDEDSLVGERVAVGDAVLDITMRIGRCVMTTRPQPGGVERDLDVLRTIHRERGGHLAVGALVARPGTVQVGDRATRAPSELTTWPAPPTGKVAGPTAG